jgi:succinyl-diaminopimelate desuccinylase
MDVIQLTRKLLSFNNINPPGAEEAIARYTGNLLEKNGFQIQYLNYGNSRFHLVAERGVSPDRPPVVFSGHFDTVPLGTKKWSVDPFAGEIKENKIFGRGSTDMKGGLAAMIYASIEAFNGKEPSGGVRLIFTADEELGCNGAQHLIKELKEPGKASALIIGEPTSNLPATGHKGALYLNAVTSGVTAHSSMPELGINAIYKAAESILRIKNFQFNIEKDPLLGYPTINVGKINGGLNINSVPDRCEFTIDIRTTPKTNHKTILQKLSDELGGETLIEKLVDLQAVATNDKDPFVQKIYSFCGIESTDPGYPKALPYLTDASVLQKIYPDVPIVILGPGQPQMAHQTDEFCFTGNIEKAVNIYKNIILHGGKDRPA